MFPRILFLGLGGTGQLALLQLKALFAEHNKRVSDRTGSGADVSASGPLPPHVRLLYVDTVAGGEHGGEALEEVECLRIALRDPMEFLRNPLSANEGETVG